MTYATATPHAATRATEADNRLVWNRKVGGHYEVWYLTCNHLASGMGFWIRYTLEAPQNDAPYAQLWFAAFDRRDPPKNFALNRRVPIAELRPQDDPFALGIGDAVLHHDSARGAIQGHGHQASWDLSWLPAARTHRHLPDLIYKTAFADTRVLTPNLDVPLRGKIVVDGRELVFEGDPGGQTHLWGRKHAHAWAWGHCNAFEHHRGAALETLSVRLKRRNIVLPPLTLLTLYLDGEVHRFTDFSDTLLARSRFETCRYAFSAQGATTRITGEYTCRPEDMILAEYHDPDGEPSYCANSEVADLRVTVWRRARPWQSFREHAVLSAPGTGHFEVAGRTPDRAITRRHETLS
jgi:hypothetical protein